MRTPKHAESFRDLVVYQRSRFVADRIFRLSQAFPRDEAFSLTSQIRRSARSIGAQIAEAWAKRRYEKHFVAKLTDADAEQQETQHWVSVARACDYLSVNEETELCDCLSEIGRMIAGMINKSAAFCGPTDKRPREVAHLPNRH